MPVMGADSWDMDVDTDILNDQSLGFSEAVKEGGIAQLVAAWIEPDKKLLWCARWTDARGHLVSVHVDPEMARGASTMGLASLAALFVSLVLAFFVPLVSMVVYAAIVVAFIGFTVAGRWEAVTVWRRSLRR